MLVRCRHDHDKHFVTVWPVLTTRVCMCICRPSRSERGGFVLQVHDNGWSGLEESRRDDVCCRASAANEVDKVFPSTHAAAPQGFG